MTNLHTQDVVPSLPSYRLIPLTQGKVAIVDEADFDWLNQWKWHVHRSSRGGAYYAQRNVSLPDGKQKMLGMHTFIVGPRKGLISDHISGNTLDNRRENLREATKHQNAMNRRIRRDNKSGHSGVFFAKREARWYAYISVEGERIYLGCFSDRESAVAARLAAEQRYVSKFIRP